ncbi:Peptidyl-prolyl cis-trans isomerase CYP18-4 [Striga hermonthica]|uniref:Peptidyl-prolyl cis-trans isomerase n=1 Tax=Striga hermonthica TaxID=68872 RepID=A0A9N7NNG5_STRHE|nr:Peptidyl-prolyl cis-trans isomerase CYP18-4 [Striga hermonthica]
MSSRRPTRTSTPYALARRVSAIPQAPPPKGSSFHRKAHRDLSMANVGPGTNDTQFFICTTRKKWLDDKHVVFRQVVEEYDVLKAVENVGSGSRQTSRQVVITDCDRLQI